MKTLVQNKYNLKPADIRKLKVLDYDRIKIPPFWRNDVIHAYCLSETTIHCPQDDEYGTYNEYWIGIYDNDAPSYKGKIRYDVYAYGGMCKYNFRSFFNEKDIEHRDDLEIQEKLLARVNWLIDEHILGFEND